MVARNGSAAGAKARPASAAATALPSSQPPSSPPARIAWLSSPYLYAALAVLGVIPAIIIILSPEVFPPISAFYDPVEANSDALDVASLSPSTPFLAPGVHNVTCHPQRQSPPVPGCSVSSGAACARVVLDDFLSPLEAAAMIRLADSALALSGGGSGPASIFDLTSGAASHRDGFLNVFAAIAKDSALAPASTSASPFTADAASDTATAAAAVNSKRESVVARLQAAFAPADVAVYRNVTERFLAAVSTHFGVTGLLPTRPSFVARLRSDVVPRTVHDEYWHPHVDTIQCALWLLLLFLPRLVPFHPSAQAM